MKKYSLLTMLILSSAEAQVLGTSTLVSQTAFCKHYDCQYVKLLKAGSNDIWTYYVSRRLNFDLFRDAAPTESVLYAARLRFVGSTMGNTDVTAINDFLAALTGVRTSSALILSCNKATTKKTLFRANEGIEGYTFVNCQRIDSTEIAFEIGTFEP